MVLEGAGTSRSTAVSGGPPDASSKPSLSVVPEASRCCDGASDLQHTSTVSHWLQK